MIMSKSASTCLNQTITLDSSNETEIINCSIEETWKKNEFFKTPRSHLKRKCTGAAKNEIMSLKDFQFRDENQLFTSSQIDKVNSFPRCNARSSFVLNDTIVLDDSIVTNSTPEKIKSTRKKSKPVARNLLSNLQKTPDLPYLSQSKLSTIKKWLQDNEIETVNTPPFFGIPRNSHKKSESLTESLKKSRRKRKVSSESSSVDSEVKKALIAVYGKDWKKQNILKKSKTEPKRSRQLLPNPKTETKSKTRSEVKIVRRNIMNNIFCNFTNGDKSDHLESPCSLGVRKLNESFSTDDLDEDKNFPRVLKPRNRTSSSPGSWKPKLADDGKRENSKKKTIKNNRTPGTTSSKVGQSTELLSSNKRPMKSFLASLSVSTPKRQCHPEAQDFKINFATKKEELTKKLFTLYNSEVFGNGLPDDMSFTWNVKMRRTAGYCYNKKILKSTGQVIRLSRIELSTKILDRADRLRDTLIHELCHAASWVIDGTLDGHGSVWAKWAHTAMKKFPELPPIKRCHNYEIASKYTYKCTGCGYSINRCTKSINTDRKRCGYCYGVLELFVNKKKRGKGEVPEFNSTRTIPPPNNFALFVKENYHCVKSIRKDAKHAEIMKVLGQQYALTKESSKTSLSKI